MAAALELLAHEPAGSLTDINIEMIAMRTVAMQNRIALDLVFAAQGVLLFRPECCTYIPDKSEHITSLRRKKNQEN